MNSIEVGVQLQLKTDAFNSLLHYCILSHHLPIDNDKHGIRRGGRGRFIIIYLTILPERRKAERRYQGRLFSWN